MPTVGRKAPRFRSSSSARAEITSPDSGRDCVKSLRSSYMGLCPQTDPGTAPCARTPGTLGPGIANLCPYMTHEIANSCPCMTRPGKTVGHVGTNAGRATERDLSLARGAVVCVAGAEAEGAPSSHRMYLSISFRKSPPPQSRQLIIYYR